MHAIASPYKSLILSFILIMIMEYIFAILGFSFFRGQYNMIQSDASVANIFDPVSTDASAISTAVSECGMMLTCYLTTFDQTFKNNGGIGAHLKPISPEETILWAMRLVFDNLFNIVILLVIVNIFFGIIIDT